LVGGVGVHSPSTYVFLNSNSGDYFFLFTLQPSSSLFLWALQSAIRKTNIQRIMDHFELNSKGLPAPCSWCLMQGIWHPNLTSWLCHLQTINLNFLNISIFSFLLIDSLLSRENYSELVTLQKNKEFNIPERKVTEQRSRECKWFTVIYQNKKLTKEATWSPELSKHFMASSVIARTHCGGGEATTWPSLVFIYLGEGVGPHSWYLVPLL